MPKDQNVYDVVIADLEAERDQLNNMISILKRRKAGTPISGVALLTSGHQAATVIPDDAFFGMTLPDAAHKYLSLMKKPKPHPELCDALLNGGFKSGATNFREVVRSTLSRHPDFLKVRRGEWGLKEWYNRGPRRTRRTIEEPSQTSPTGETGGENE